MLLVMRSHQFTHAYAHRCCSAAMSIANPVNVDGWAETGTSSGGTPKGRGAKGHSGGDDMELGNTGGASYF